MSEGEKTKAGVPAKITRGAAGSRSVGKAEGRSCLGIFLALVGIFVSLLWILNLGFGIVEIPDYLPIVGNLDEAFFTTLFWICLAYFGIEIPFLKRLIERKK